MSRKGSSGITIVNMVNDELVQLNLGLKALQLDDLPMSIVKQLLQYLTLLSKWNQVYNLTALRKRSEMLSYHVLDSLSIVNAFRQYSTLLDVGSGGGIPGIILAIARPDLQVTLVDANSKKTAFLRQATVELGLKTVIVKTARVEQMQHASFDYVISRALAKLREFVVLTEKLLNKEGIWLAMKGRYPREELAKLPEWIEILAVNKLKIPQLNAERHLVSLRKKG